MKIFSITSKPSEQGPKVSNATMNFSADEIGLIVRGLESLKNTGNDVLESVKFNLLETLKTL